MSATNEKSSIFIYGSCVSRDSFDFFTESKFELLDYVARQSLVSSFSDSADVAARVTDLGLSSKWQTEMLEGDVSSSLPEQLHRASCGIDLVLCDFVDERGGLLMGDDGSIVTDSAALRSSKLSDIVGSSFRHVRFGSDEHFELWCAAFQQFHDLLVSLDLAEKTVIIRHDWAQATVQGDVFPLPGSRMDPKMMNNLYRRYFEYISHFSRIDILEIPENLCIGTTLHKWGPAPFHYSDPFYEHVKLHIESKWSSHE